jgi:hypothetical protein
MEITEVTVNGEKVKYLNTFDGIFIPYKEMKNTKPIFGSISKAYYCPSQPKEIKWEVQIRNKALSKILKKDHLAYYENRADAEKFVKHLDTFLTF